MKSKISDTTIFLIAIMSPMGGIMIGWGVIALTTPEKYRNELNYWPPWAAIFMMMFGLAFIILGVVGSLKERDVKVTDEEIRKQVNNKARELLQKTIISNDN